jgi:hypothetical protein
VGVEVGDDAQRERGGPRHMPIMVIPVSNILECQIGKSMKS